MQVFADAQTSLYRGKARKADRDFVGVPEGQQGGKAQWPWRLGQRLAIKTCTGSTPPTPTIFEKNQLFDLRLDLPHT